MAKLLRAVSWRRLERPNTRKSKFSKKAYVKAVPQNKIVKYVMGDTKADYKFTLTLHSDRDIQLRHNALESARKTANKLLETKIGKTGYMYRLRLYPHHILRNNPLATGAGADRMSTGMARSFGKAIGLAAQVRKGQALMEVLVNKEHIQTARDALKRAQFKLPCGCRISMDEKK
ncbi:MAG: 50S ribosomal protein L16 [Nanoarchaeota archaeon]